MKRPLLFAMALAHLATLAPPASAGRLGGASAPDIDLVRIFAAFALCALIAVAAAALLQRARGGVAKASLARFLDPRTWPKPQPAKISVLETHRMSLHGDICRVQADNKEYVLVVGTGGTTILSSTDRVEERPDTP